jgi:hypothetical protein
MGGLTKVVRARMSPAESRALAKLAHDQGATVSEFLRRLVREEAERSARRASHESSGFLAEKIAHALRLLTLREDPSALATAFEVIGQAVRGTPTFSTAGIDAIGWFETMRHALETSDADTKDPRARQQGVRFIRAERMTRDEKTAFANALWSVHDHLNKLRG